MVMEEITAYQMEYPDVPRIPKLPLDKKVADPMQINVRCYDRVIRARIDIGTMENLLKEESPIWSHLAKEMEEDPGVGRTIEVGHETYCTYHNVAIVEFNGHDITAEFYSRPEMADEMILGWKWCYDNAEILQEAGINLDLIPKIDDDDPGRKIGYSPVDETTVSESSGTPPPEFIQGSSHTAVTNMVMVHNDPVIKAFESVKVCDSAIMEAMKRAWEDEQSVLETLISGVEKLRDDGWEGWEIPRVLMMNAEEKPTKEFPVIGIPDVTVVMFRPPEPSMHRVFSPTQGIHVWWKDWAIREYAEAYQPGMVQGTDPFRMHSAEDSIPILFNQTRIAYVPSQSYVRVVMAGDFIREMRIFPEGPIILLRLDPGDETVCLPQQAEAELHRHDWQRLVTSLPGSVIDKASLTCGQRAIQVQFVELQFGQPFRAWAGYQELENGLQTQCIGTAPFVAIHLNQIFQTHQQQLPMQENGKTKEDTECEEVWRQGTLRFISPVLLQLEKDGICSKFMVKIDMSTTAVVGTPPGFYQDYPPESGFYLSKDHVKSILAWDRSTALSGLAMIQNGVTYPIQLVLMEEQHIPYVASYKLEDYREARIYTWANFGVKWTKEVPERMLRYLTLSGSEVEHFRVERMTYLSQEHELVINEKGEGCCGSVKLTWDNRRGSILVQNKKEFVKYPPASDIFISRHGLAKLSLWRIGDVIREIEVEANGELYLMDFIPVDESLPFIVLKGLPSASNKVAVDYATTSVMAWVETQTCSPSLKAFTNWGTGSQSVDCQLLPPQKYSAWTQVGDKLEMDVSERKRELAEDPSPPHTLIAASDTAHNAFLIKDTMQAFRETQRDQELYGHTTTQLLEGMTRIEEDVVQELRRSERLTRDEQNRLLDLAEEIYVISSWAMEELEENLTGSISEMRSMGLAGRKLIGSIREQLLEFLKQYREFKAQLAARVASEALLSLRHSQGSSAQRTDQIVDMHVTQREMPNTGISHKETASLSSNQHPQTIQNPQCGKSQSSRRRPRSEDNDLMTSDRTQKRHAGKRPRLTIARSHLSEFERDREPQRRLSNNDSLGGAGTVMLLEVEAGGINAETGKDDVKGQASSIGLDLESSMDSDERNSWKHLSHPQMNNPLTDEHLLAMTGTNIADDSDFEEVRSFGQNETTVYPIDLEACKISLVRGKCDKNGIIKCIGGGDNGVDGYGRKRDTSACWGCVNKGRGDCWKGKTHRKRICNGLDKFGKANEEEVESSEEEFDRDNTESVRRKRTSSERSREGSSIIPKHLEPSEKFSEWFPEHCGYWSDELVKTGNSNKVAWDKGRERAEMMENDQGSREEAYEIGRNGVQSMGVKMRKQRLGMKIYDKLENADSEGVRIGETLKYKSLRTHLNIPQNLLLTTLTFSQLIPTPIVNSANCQEIVMETLPGDHPHITSPIHDHTVPLNGGISSSVETSTVEEGTDQNSHGTPYRMPLRFIPNQMPLVPPHPLLQHSRLYRPQFREFIANTNAITRQATHYQDYHRSIVLTCPSGVRAPPTIINGQPVTSYILPNVSVVELAMNGPHMPAVRVGTAFVTLVGTPMPFTQSEMDLIPSLSAAAIASAFSNELAQLYGADWNPDRRLFGQLFTCSPSDNDYVEVVPPISPGLPFRDDLTLDSMDQKAKYVASAEHLLQVTAHEIDPERVMSRIEMIIKADGDNAIGTVTTGLGDRGLNFEKKCIRESIEMMATDGRPVLTQRYVVDKDYVMDLADGTPYQSEELCCLAAYAAERYGGAAFLTKAEYPSAPPIFQEVDQILRRCAEPISSKNRHWEGVYTSNKGYCDQLIRDVLSRFDLSFTSIGPHIPSRLDVPYLEAYPGSPQLVITPKHRFSPFTVEVDHFELYRWGDIDEGEYQKPRAMDLLHLVPRGTRIKSRNSDQRQELGNTELVERESDDEIEEEEEFYEVQKYCPQTPSSKCSSPYIPQSPKHASLVVSEFDEEQEIDELETSQSDKVTLPPANNLPSGGPVMESTEIQLPPIADMLPNLSLQPPTPALALTTLVLPASMSLDAEEPDFQERQSLMQPARPDSASPLSQNILQAAMEMLRSALASQLFRNSVTITPISMTDRLPEGEENERVWISYENESLIKSTQDQYLEIAVPIQIVIDPDRESDHLATQSGNTSNGQTRSNSRSGTPDSLPDLISPSSSTDPTSDTSGTESEISIYSSRLDIQDIL